VFNKVMSIIDRSFLLRTAFISSIGYGVSWGVSKLGFASIGFMLGLLSGGCFLLMYFSEDRRRVFDLMNEVQEKRHQSKKQIKNTNKYDDFQGYATNKKQAYGFAGLILLLLSYFSY